MNEEVIIVKIKNQKKRSLKFGTFLSTLLSIVFAGSLFSHELLSVS